MRHSNSGQQRPLDSYLERFPAIRSRSPEATAHKLFELHGARHFRLKGSASDFFAHINHKQFNDIALCYCAFGSAIEVDFPGTECARQKFCISGHASLRSGGTEVAFAVNESVSIPPHHPLRLRLSDGFQQIVLRIDEAPLARRLAALLGDEPAKPLQIVAKNDANQGHELLRRLVFLAARESDAFGEAPEFSPSFRELEQAIVIAFLFANYSDPAGDLATPPKESAPWQVRLVEDYIAANWDKPIDIATLVGITGTSARSIFQSFSRARNYSPMLFLKRTRLEQAKSRLQSGDAQTSVTGIAYACGFHNLGHFARDYRAAFGELPSETLRKARRI